MATDAATLLSPVTWTAAGMGRARGRAGKRPSRSWAGSEDATRTGVEDGDGPEWRENGENVAEAE